MVKLFFLTLLICAGNLNGMFWNVSQYDELYISIIDSLIYKYKPENMMVFRDVFYNGNLEDTILKKYPSSSKVLLYGTVMKTIPIWFQKKSIVISLSNFYNPYSEEYNRSPVRITIGSSLSQIMSAFDARNALILIDGQMLKFDYYYFQLLPTNLEMFDHKNEYKHGLNYMGDRIERFQFPYEVIINDTTKETTGVMTFFNNEFLKHLNRNVSESAKTIMDCTQVKYLVDLAEASVPLFTEKYCIMVPTANAITNNLYIRYAFKGSTWLLIGVYGIYFTVALKLFYKLDISQGLRNAMEFITLTSFSKQYSYKSTLFKRFPIEIMVFLFMWIFGFVISNLYMATFSTYMTTYLYSGAIRTDEDLIASNLTIYITVYINHVQYTKLPSSLHLQTFKYFENGTDFCHLSTNFAYFLPTSHWNFVEMCQSRLLKKRFELTNICANRTKHGPYFHYSSIQVSKEIEDDIKADFSWRVFQSGLMKMWETLSFMEIKKLGRYEYLRDNPDVREPLNLNFFQICWIILLSGWISSFMCFALEVVFYRIWGFLILNRVMRLM